MAQMNNELRHGLRQLEQKAYEAVHKDAIELIKRDIHDPVPYFLLGRVAEDHKNFEKASELLEKAATLAPADPFFLAGYARYLIAVGNQHRALELADSAATLVADDAWTADTIGVVYSRAGFHEKAIPHFETAVALNAEPSNYHYNLGASRQFSGEFEGAEKAYLDAIARDPDAYRAYSSLVGLSRQTPDKNYLTRLEFLFGELQGEPDAALHLGHAIAKTLEDLDDYERSFDWLVKAKAAKRNALSYEVSEDLALFDAAKDTIDHGQTGHETSPPIFIVGLPRTGTTLVDRILSSHSEVTSAGELNTFAGLIKNAAGTASNRVLDTETLAATSDINFNDIGERYLNDTKHLARGSARFTDKMPLNFFYAGLIHRAMPDARIVILRRNPLDSCLSNFRQLFSTGFSYYNYALSIDDTAEYYMAFENLIEHWKQNLPGNRVHEIYYEDIVKDQENQTRQLLDFCKLSWDENCLRFHENTAPVSTASSVQVRQPLYAGSVGRWQRYGDRIDGLRKKLGIFH